MIIGIFSDAHGDLAALQQALALLRNVDRLYYLGDVHEFVPEVKECIDLLQAHKVITIKGNCDRHAVIEDRDGYYRRWLEALPRQHRENGLVFVHEPQDPEYAFSRNNFKICFCGHTHRSFLISPLGQEKLHPGFSVKLNQEQTYIVGIGSISRPRQGEDKVVAIFDTTDLELQLVEL